MKKDMTHEELEVLLINWEGGALVDRDLLINELAKVFRDVLAQERLNKLV